jgi:hypothetical protein
MLANYVSQKIYRWLISDCKELGIILVPKKGLEPPHPCEYMDLNHARLPIPPLRHGKDVQRERLDEQQFLDYFSARFVSIRAQKRT